MFNSILSEVDPTIANAIALEGKRQADQNELIASENIVSKPILEAQGSLLTNKYTEGYPGRRYYGGCEHVDVVEAVVIECLCTIFDANLQMFMPCTSSNG